MDSRAIMAGLAFLACAAAPACAADGDLRDDIAGRLRVAALYQEPVSALARRNGVSTLSVLAANWGLDQWEPQTRERVLLPTAHIVPTGLRDGILVNRGEYRIYYFRGGELVQTSPIGVGEPGMETPLGRTTIVRKQKDPTWYPTPEARAEHPDWPASVPPGPSNPLGRYALYLGWNHYLIHGSIDEYGIGRPYTRGCVRLFPEDIERLFNSTPLGTAVEVVDQPVKLGWREGELFLESHPDFAQLEELRVYARYTLKPAPDLRNWIAAEAGAEAGNVDWDLVARVLERRSGVPTQISRVKTHPVSIIERGDLVSDLGHLIPSAARGFAGGGPMELSAEERKRMELRAAERLAEHRRAYPYNE